jgi:4-hydroxy-2-oxoglutarate aldolase
MANPLPPPPGIYVPAVVFFKDDEELDFNAIKSHVLRLAQVRAHFAVCVRIFNSTS